MTIVIILDDYPLSGSHPSILNPPTDSIFSNYPRNPIKKKINFLSKTRNKTFT